MNITPLFDRVLVKPSELNETTKSGIVIPETVEKDKPERGEIMAVGLGKMLENGTRAPVTLKVGDMVMFKKYSPDEIKMDGKKFLILDEADVLAIIS